MEQNETNKNLAKVNNDDWGIELVAPLFFQKKMRMPDAKVSFEIKDDLPYVRVDGVDELGQVRHYGCFPKNEATEEDIKFLTENKANVIGFHGFWGCYLEDEIDAETGVTVTAAKWAKAPKIWGFQMKDGSEYKLHGDVKEYIAE